MLKIKKIILFAVVFFFLILKSVSADTYISSCGSTLSTYGETYYLANDISTGSGDCITITANSVKLRCQGHSITGPSPSSPYNGIRVRSSYNTITNCKISNFKYGIFLESLYGINAYYNNIYSNNLSSNNYGIYLSTPPYTSNYNTVYNNFFKNQGNDAYDTGSNYWNTNKKLAFNETNLVSYWRFDEGTGTTAYDSSVNNNNGVLIPGIIDDFNDGDVSDWALDCGGNALSSIVSGYEGLHAARVWPAGGDGLACAFKTPPLSMSAGEGISFACRGFSDNVCRLSVWDITNGKSISSGEGNNWHNGDSNWHIYTTKVDETQSNSYIYIYSSPIGSWSEYDFITRGPMWVDGKYGKALSFDGLNDYVQVPDSPTLDITSAITIGSWVKIDSILKPVPGVWGGDMGLISRDLAYMLGYQSFSDETANATAWLLIDGWKQIVGPRLNTGTWYHEVVTYDGSTIKLYLNGNEVANLPQTGVINTNDWPLGIGARFVFGGPYNPAYFNGVIDEVKIYSRALSADEISKEYERGTSGKNIAGGPYLGGNYWSNYFDSDSDGDGLGDTPYNIPGGGNRDNLPLMKCASNADCSDNIECTDDQCSSGYCSNPNKVDGSSCSGYPGKCCSGICDNNGMSGLGYHQDCRIGPQCFGTQWDYMPANDGSLCGGYNCRECSSGYCIYDDNSKCVGNCDSCNGNCLPTSQLCTGTCSQCTGSGTNYSCTPQNQMCGGNCVYCSGSGTNYNCAPNETVCENNYKCASCFGDGTYFNCNFDSNPAENDDCNPFDLTGIATCFNNPDNYDFTWDFRLAFDSHCVGFNTCNQGNPTITHTCNQTCGANCDESLDCSNQCLDKKWYSTYSCNNQCNCDLSNPVCTYGKCGAECSSDSDCTGGKTCNLDMCICEDVTPPTISILSPKNDTEFKTSIPLEFTIDPPETSWIGYSLDGNSTVMIPENYTLSGLTDGPHNVIVYANDTSGIMGMSETRYFFYCKGDITKDKIIDIFDLVNVALAFGSKPGDANWNANADLNDDNIIDIFDIVVIATNYGKAC